MKPVQLAVRLRPVRAEALSDAKAKELVFTTAADGGPGAVVLKDGKDGKDVSSVNVDYLWGKDATTESIFAGSVAPYVDQVLDGTNATITLFGGRESGKGFTMSELVATTAAGFGAAKPDRKDDKKDEKDRDVADELREAQALMEAKVFAKLSPSTFAAQSAVHLFNAIKQRSATHKYLVTVSVFQVSTSPKEAGPPRVTDMLNPRVSSGSAGNAEPDGGLRVIDHRSFGAYVEPLAELEVTTAEELKEYLTQAARVMELLRARNPLKNKPHTFYDLRVESKTVSDAYGTVRSARLRFAELAGMGLIRFDSGLQTFKAVLDVAGSDPSGTGLAPPAHRIPYGDSTVTRLLEQSLGGNSYLLFFGFFDPLHPAPSKEQSPAVVQTRLDRTLEAHRAVMDVMSRARQLRNAPKRNVNNIDSLKAQLRNEIKAVRSKCSLTHPSAYKPTDVNPEFLKQWQALTDELNRVKSQTWDARRRRSNDAVIERQASLQSGSLLTLAGVAGAGADGAGAGAGATASSGGVGGGGGAAPSVAMFDSIAALTGKGRVSGMELVLTQELATESGQPYQTKLAQARGAADLIIRAMVSVDRNEAKLKKQRDIYDKAVRLHGSDHDDVKSRAILIRKMEVELKRNTETLKRERPVFEESLTAALRMELRQKKGVNPPHEASRLQEVKDLQQFKTELASHPVTDQAVGDQIQLTANDQAKEAAASFARAFDKAVGPAQAQALAAAVAASAAAAPQVASAPPPPAPVNVANGPAPEWLSVRAEALAQFHALAKEYAKSDWEKRKYMARLMERDFRHYFHLHTFQQHMMHVFRKYRLHFEAQKLALDTRYRALVEGSVKDALDLHAENTQLKAQIAELLKNQRQGML